MIFYFLSEAIKKNHDISVIVFAAQPDLFVQRIAGRFYELNCLLNADTSEYTFCSVEADFGVNFTLSPQGKKHPVKPGMSALIKPGCRHCAIGNLKVINVPLPAFDPEDEYFD